VNGLVRPLGNLFGDVLDNVFNIDTRIVRTLGPLFAKPGFLTTEYFAGRQVRYVTPVRLFFFLAIIAFFVAQVATDDPRLNLDADTDTVASATTVADVERERDARLAELAKAKADVKDTPGEAGASVGIDIGTDAVRDAASKRIQQLKDAQAKGEPVPPPITDNFNINFDGAQWDAQKHPIDTWLPGFADRWLNGQMARGKRNIERLKQDPASFKNAVLSAVPTTLFVLVPVFALMLMLAYVFKRRLYMEHVVVSLHSHAFLCLDLLLVLLVAWLQHWLAPDAGTLQTLFGWIEGLLLAWMPIYLLIMQKRVYAQGWPMTLLKYCALGLCYTILLSFAVVAAVAIGLVAM
jgi:hypothetical protein